VITDTGGECAGCAENEFPSQGGQTCSACPANTASPAGSAGIWECKANAGYFAKYTKTLQLTLELPEEDADPATIEAYVRAAAGGGDEVRVIVEA